MGRFVRKGEKGIAILAGRRNRGAGTEFVMKQERGLKHSRILPKIGGQLQSEWEPGDSHWNGNGGRSERGPRRVHSWVASRG
jgi:hypothetical protein